MELNAQIWDLPNGAYRVNGQSVRMNSINIKC